MNASPPRRPTFLILGAPKCGTTSLAYYLSQHPDVFFSEPKEPIFFEAEYEKGLDYYWQTYFRDWQGQKAIGEGRVWHLYLPFVAARIRESLPDARLVAVLRDPVDRVFSQWWHRYSRGQERLGFEEAIAEDRARVARGQGFGDREGEQRWRAGLYQPGYTTRHRAMLDLGFYAEQLERYLALYPADRLHLIFYEDLVTDLPAVLRGLFAFVGVDPRFEIQDAAQLNVRRDRIRSPAARKLLMGVRALGMRHLIPRRLRGPLRGLIPEREAQRPPLRPETRRELVTYYAPHVARLEALLGRELPTWRRGAS